MIEIEKWAKKIKCRMINNDILQKAVAEKLGVHTSYVGMLLNGVRISPNIGYAEMNKAIDEIIAERE